MLENKYLKYGIKKFFSYLLIGLMASSFMCGVLGMLAGAIPVIICSIICSIHDVKTLKTPPHDPFIVFTKRHIIIALILLVVSLCWYLYYHLLCSSGD